MTITILRRRPDQKVARPINRACSVAELSDLLIGWNKQSRRNAPLVGVTLELQNIDTDEPVGVHADGTEFFAFTEE